MENYDRALKLLTEGKSISEMSYELKVKPQVVYEIVKQIINSGYVFRKNIFDNGHIRFFKGYSELLKKQNSETINLTHANSFRAVLISDTHFGNENANISYLEKVYDYCKRENIHIILNGGDLIDGHSSLSNRSIMSPKEQLKYVINNYPYSDNIINLICLGNHDYQLFDLAIDIKKALMNERFDLIPIGYGQGIINVGKDQLVIKHPISNYDFIDSKGKLTLYGHSHKCLFDLSSNKLILPSLSDLNFKKYIPSFIDMNLSLKNGKFCKGIFTVLTVKNEVEKVSIVSSPLITFDNLEINQEQKCDLNNNEIINLPNERVKKITISDLKKKRR